MAGEENKAVVRRFLEEALSTSNLALMDELLAPDYVNRGMVAGSRSEDRETWKQHAAMIFASIPDLRISVRDLLAEGDMVVARYIVRGTHRGDLFGIRASGHSQSVSGVGWYRLKNVKIVEEWPGLDTSGMMQQPGADTHRERGEGSMSGNDSKAIMHRFLEALSQRDPAAAAELLAPDAVCHVPGLPEAIQGREAWKHLFQMYLAAFPDMEITVHEEIAQEETAMARWSWSGSHRGPLMEIPATGRTVSGISGMGVFRMGGSVIAEEWVIEDTLGIMQQLGVIPQPEQAGA